MKTRMLCGLVLLASLASWSSADEDRTLTLHTRCRPAVDGDGSQFGLAYETVQWDATKTAIVICDMWNQHWCKSATARVAEMAPRMNRLVDEARRRGVLIIHAPSSTLDTYKDTPGRKLAEQAPKVEPKTPLQGWCRLDPEREKGGLPIDDSDGGCPCQPRCPGGNPWTSQIDTLTIAPGDAITDSAEAYYLMRQRGIENVIVMGVHTNMCVLGRPFGIRQMVNQGMRVLLVRDMTDTMYNPRMRPKVSHFRGTELVVEHIEKFWCPTITSADFLGGAAFHFKEDRRPHVVFLISEDEYHANETLPVFAQLLRDRSGDRCTVVLGHGKQDLSGVEALASADLAVVYVRRRAFPKEQLDVLREYLAAGKPLIGLRTASHAFSIKRDSPEGLDQWPEFDNDVLGGNYHGHGSNAVGTDVTVVSEAAGHPILAGVDTAAWHSEGSLYNVLPIDEKATVLLHGTAPDMADPIAWTRTYQGGRIFYTSLGYRTDFDQPQFRRLLINAVDWALDRQAPEQ